MIFFYLISTNWIIHDYNDECSHMYGRKENIYIALLKKKFQKSALQAKGIKAYWKLTKLPYISFSALYIVRYIHRNWKQQEKMNKIPCAMLTKAFFACFLFNELARYTLCLSLSHSPQWNNNWSRWWSLIYCNVKGKFLFHSLIFLDDVKAKKINHIFPAWIFLLPLDPIVTVRWLVITKLMNY